MDHYYHARPLTPGDIVVLAVLLSVVILFWRAALTRTQRARAAVRRALVKAGYQIIRLQYRWLFFGSGLGLPGRGQMTYRFIACDSTGQERAGWARWGRVGVFDSDRLELRWDDEPASSVFPG